MPDGRSHNEVKTGFGLITTLTGYTWTEQHRDLPVDKKTKISKATMHKSVYDDSIYQPSSYTTPGFHIGLSTLRNHIDFAKYYEPGAVFPATSLSSATEMADDPLERKKRKKKRRIH